MRAHELRAEGDYAGFMGTTQQGAAVVIGPRPGGVAARGGAGSEGQGLGEVVIYMLGGLGAVGAAGEGGQATRLVRMFVPGAAGGAWVRCGALCQPRAFAAAAYMPAPEAAARKLRAGGTAGGGGGGEALDVRAAAPARLVVVGGVGESRRALTSAEVLDLSCAGLGALGFGQDGGLGGTLRADAEKWRFRERWRLVR